MASSTDRDPRFPGSKDFLKRQAEKKAAAAAAAAKDAKPADKKKESE